MEFVLLNMIGGKIIPEITMLESSTIAHLKERIEELTKVDVGRQTLKFNNEELMNDKTIADYGIKYSVELVLEVTPLPGEPEFKIRVNFGDQAAEFDVKEITSVAEIRDKICKHWGIPSGNANLYLLGYMKMDDDDAPLSAYYLCEGSQVEVKVTESC